MLVVSGSRSAALAACAALLLTTAACFGDDAEDSPTAHVRLYGADGIMQNSFIKEFKEPAGLLDGMKGTSPLTPLPENFKERLREVSPKLSDFVYAGESYDAVAISTLAAQLAGTTDPAEIAKQINGVTNGGERCDSIQRCLQLARNGRDIEYRGISIVRGGFTDVGEPSTATYATLHFGQDEQLDDGKTEFLGAGDESAASAEAPPPAKRQAGLSRQESGAPLKLGELLPRTGDLALLYPAMAAGATLAINEVNEAGGVLGEPVEWVNGDDGTSSDVAKATVASHVQKGVHVIIGAAASGITREVLPDVVAAGLILFSPSNTAADLSSADDSGLYFRTAPSDLLQGRALADVILRDGSDRIVIIARGDTYGEGLQEHVRAELERAGHGADQVKLFSYEPPENADAPPVDFTASAEEIRRFNPEGVLIIGFGESAQIIESLVAAGVEPAL
jgi:ABC-type branched-subunit amino acid transport system substrate-binding protein